MQGKNTQSYSTKVIFKNFKTFYIEDTQGKRISIIQNYVAKFADF